MRVLIIGFGKLGQRLGLHLTRQGHQVTGLKRHAVERPGMPCLAADISDYASLQGLPADYDHVVCMLSAGHREPAAYQAIYQTGIQNLQRWLAAQGRRPHWLFVSSTSVYGQHRGEWIDEDSETRPSSATARILLAAERLILADSQSHTILRFSGIYGGERSWLLRRVRQGVPVQQQPPVYTNRIHEDDCVRVLAFLLQQRRSGRSLAPIYLASDHDPAPQWEVHCWLAEQMGCPTPEPQQGLDGEKQNKRCRNQRLLALGYVFTYPGYREGYAQVLKDSAALL